MPERRKRRRRLAPAAHKPDGKKGKKNPASLCETLRGVRRHWPADDGQYDRDIPTFWAEFEPHLHDVFERYKGLGAKPTNSLKYIQTTESGSKAISYFHIRAYADYIGTPSSLLLLYSHLVGKCATRSVAILRFYRSCELVYPHLMHCYQRWHYPEPIHLSATTSEKSLLKRQDLDSKRAEYNVSTVGLQTLSDAYKDHDGGLVEASGQISLDLGDQE